MLKKIIYHEPGITVITTRFLGVCIYAKTIESNRYGTNKVATVKLCGIKTYKKSETVSRLQNL